MDVSVRQLRNQTARVIAALERGESVALTVHDRPIADIIPRRMGSEGRSTVVFLAELSELSDLAGALGVVSDPRDFDVGLTTDDMPPLSPGW